MYIFVELIKRLTKKITKYLYNSFPLFKNVRKWCFIKKAAIVISAAVTYQYHCDGTNKREQCGLDATEQCYPPETAVCV